jgi:hypothetical protein
MLRVASQEQNAELFFHLLELRIAPIKIAFGWLM